jgi:flagellar biosynthesis protein FlhF
MERSRNAKPMKLKSYYSPTVEDAIALARQQLGPDAMLVNSRRALPETRHLGDYEVVFVTDAPAAPLDDAEPSAQPPRAPDRLSADVSDLKRELETMRRALTRSAYAPQPWKGAAPGSYEAYSTLTASDLNPELARAIVDSAESRVQQGPRRAEPAAFDRALSQELASRISVQPVLGRGEAKPHVVALVGPPGCGKTTTLVKLAVNYGLASRRPVLLLSMDTYRVAAADQLRSYAAILGVGFHLLETVAALAQTIEENRGKELIFIDTPGFAFGDLDASADVAQFLASRQDIDTQLVLPSSMKGPDLTRIVDAFEIFRPQRLLFTKTDETNSFGPIVNESNRTGKPVSFLGTGQRIPEDLETASAARLVDLILRPRQCGAAGAAA